ncbi:MAG: hypothetical protein KBT47_09280, partial [Armatimonadetes bacterium]|nr:hypothetical protein [Candidatus Hippobium faecium]
DNRIDAHNLFGLLSDRGSEALGGINVSELSSYTGDILVLFFEDFPEEEAEIIRNYKGGRVIEINCIDDSIILSVNGEEKAREKYVPEKMCVSFSMFYVYELELAEPTCEFLDKCVEEINSGNRYFDTEMRDGLFQKTSLRATLNICPVEEGRLRCVLRNDNQEYVLALIKPKIMPKDIKIITDFPVIRFKDFSEFKVTVPNKGIVIFDMIY